MDKREDKNPFYVKNGRAMVSLGPLNKIKYCTYSCAFCYVQDGFLKYKNMCVNDICNFLQENQQNFKIIYISGDTDSFAPPRTSQGLELLSCISERIDKDILFTTRMVFSDEEMKEIISVKDKMMKKGKDLFACISITSPIGERSIEPIPIKTIEERIKQLALFKDNNIFSILAMRPFLPIYSLDQYKELILKAYEKVDCILGERWFFHQDDIIYKRVMEGKEINSGNIILTEMDFDENFDTWNLWYDEQLENAIKELCNQLGVPFYMRSAPAIEYLKGYSKCDGIS